MKKCMCWCLTIIHIQFNFSRMYTFCELLPLLRLFTPFAIVLFQTLKYPTLCTKHCKILRNQTTFITKKYLLMSPHCTHSRDCEYEHTLFFHLLSLIKHLSFPRTYISSFVWYFLLYLKS